MPHMNLDCVSMVEFGGAYCSMLDKLGCNFQFSKTDQHLPQSMTDVISCIVFCSSAEAACLCRLSAVAIGYSDYYDDFPFD